MQGTDAQRLARLYDVMVPDWPGELDFYRQHAAPVMATGAPVLEIACGTGRVCLRLAQAGAHVVGLDRSAEMLDVARRKSGNMPNVRWVQADMRRFDLRQTFGLIIIPGHSFQYLVTVEDQVACLHCIDRHLAAGGRLILHLDHQNMDWLGDLCRDRGGVFAPAREARDPETGNAVRSYRAWWYARSTQTATTAARYEEVDALGEVVDRWETEPVALHCAFAFEVAHLLARTGYRVAAVYGDFFGNALTDSSEEMIWVATREG